MNTPIRRLEINDKTLDFFSENVRKCVNNNVWRHRFLVFKSRDADSFLFHLIMQIFKRTSIMKKTYTLYKHNGVIEYFSISW